jgi:hypothetical protein
MKTLIKTSTVKEYLPLLDREEITVSRFAELLNEAANRALTESEEAEQLKHAATWGGLYENSDRYYQETWEK